ncbi:MAG: DUF3108 domain-containing protein [Elusimicrobiota bacterium]
MSYSRASWLVSMAAMALPLILLGLDVPTTGHAAIDAPMALKETTSLAEVARTIGLGREDYVYSVSWGMIKVGRSSLGSYDIVPFNGKEAYHIVSTARTLPFFDTFYKVRDRNESWLETKTFISMGFGKHLREGRFRRSETVIYDHAAGKFMATVHKNKGEPVQEEGPMKPMAYDVLSALYWVRAQNLKVGQEISIDVNTRQDWPLAVRVLGEERIRVPAGEFQCLKVEPVLRGEGIFIQKGKSMQIWFTNDARKIPILVKADVFIGAVKAELEEIIYSDLPKPKVPEDFQEPEGGSEDSEASDSTKKME